MMRSTARTATGSAWLLALLCLSACGPDARTQVMVTVDAAPEVRLQGQTLQIVVLAGPTNDSSQWTEVGRHTFTGGAVGISWPVPLALVPRNGGARSFEVNITVFDADDVAFAGAAVGTGYRARQTLWLPITIQPRCYLAVGVERCGATTLDPADLPLWQGSPFFALPDAGADGGPSDGGLTDGGDAGDAGPPPDTSGPCDDVADCDDANRCTVDTCVEMACEHAPVACGPEEACNPATGLCDCLADTVRCMGECVAGIQCCPGQVGGSCARCGTEVCNADGEWECTQQGACSPGDLCASCCLLTTSFCNDDCQWSRCL